MCAGLGWCKLAQNHQNEEPHPLNIEARCYRKVHNVPKGNMEMSQFLQQQGFTEL